MLMAATAISLQLRPIRHRLPQNPNFINFFSSSSSFSDDESPSSPPEPQPQSFASYFNNVKSSLKQTPSSQQQQPPRPFYPSSSNTNESLSRVSSFEEVRRKLSGYRRRATTPPPPNLSQQLPISFQELHQRSVSEKNNLGSTNVAGRTGQLSLNEIRQSLVRKTASPQSQVDGPKMMSLDRLKEGLKLRQQPEINDKFPLLVKTETRNEAESDATKTKFLRSYCYIELGNKLRTLRPDGKGKNCFSLTELNERLTKMRELEDKETDSRVGGPILMEFRQCLVKLSENKAEKNSSMRFNVLSQHGKNAEYMLKPPKEELVEKYFHPDNMSSSEKLKIELKRVRDEFKISESDCGSARVQVAQLTTRIKHLSNALHKKDKHSRKGLQGMVQQRKKLLKYLRRTDWDSYCLVLSRLGLRDNPDYKN